MDKGGGWKCSYGSGVGVLNEGSDTSILDARDQESDGVELGSR